MEAAQSIVSKGSFLTMNADIRNQGEKDAIRQEYKYVTSFFRYNK